MVGNQLSPEPDHRGQRGDAGGEGDGFGSKAGQVTAGTGHTGREQRAGRAGVSSQSPQGPERSREFSWFPRTQLQHRDRTSPRLPQTGQCRGAGGSSARGSAQPSPWQGIGAASLGASPQPPGVHHASALAIGDALPRGAELHLLSGTRTSQGNGMVGLLSLTSITTTVSVAEPTRGGVPLSIAVTTNLRVSTRAQQKVHRHVAIDVGAMRGVLHVCTGLEGARVAVELCRASGASGTMEMSIWSAGVGQRVCVHGECSGAGQQMGAQSR